MVLQEFIRWLALGTFGMAALTSLRSFRYNYPSPLRRLSVLWVVLFVVDVFGNMIRISMEIDNLWLYNVFNWIWYPSLAYLYMQVLQSTIIRTIIRNFLVLFPLFVLADLFLIEGIYRLQSLVVIFGGSFVTFLAAAYFRQLYLSEENGSITADPWFWFSFGFIVYFAGASIPYLGMLNDLSATYPAFSAYYYNYIYLPFTILLHLLIITGYLCRRNYQKSR